MKLFSERELIFVQKKELGELFGFETRNKFHIFDGRKNLIAYAAEENTGWMGFIARQFLGHWRRFKIHFYDENKREVLIAHHPFRWLFARLEVYSPEGQFHGALQRRFSLLSKRFELEDQRGRVVLRVDSPWWRPWSFNFQHHQAGEVASVAKKWGGLLKEAFLDADSFQLLIKKDYPQQAELGKVLVAAALFIDLQFFEAKAR